MECWLYSKKANDASYIPFEVPFEAAFTMPVVFMLVDKNERQKFGQIFVLYTEIMPITGAMFTIAAGAGYLSIEQACIF